jgi:hypothetical protein
MIRATGPNPSGLHANQHNLKVLKHQYSMKKERPHPRYSLSICGEWFPTNFI